MPDFERLAASVIAQVRTRLELVSVEWQEEKLRLGRQLLLLLFVLFFVQLAIVMAVLGIVIAYWESTQRLTLIGFAAVMSTVAAWLCWRVFRGHLEARPKAFETSIEELRADERALRRQESGT